MLIAGGKEIGPEAILLTRTGDAAGSDGAGASRRSGVTGLVGQTVADVERELIIDTLHHCLGNRTHAANILGISIRTLRNKLKLYNQQGYTVPTPGEAQRRAL